MVHGPSLFRVRSVGGCSKGVSLLTLTPRAGKTAVVITLMERRACTNFPGEGNHPEGPVSGNEMSTVPC